MRLIVGLGNPGKEYKKTRHNAGFLTVDRLCKKKGLQFERSRKLKAEVAKGDELIILKPRTYMNLSGLSVKEAKNSYGAGLNQILIVSDDTALPFGELRMRKSGSSGGHKGLKNIEELLQSQEYTRLRLGIGKPREGQLLEEYVLEPFGSEEQEGLEKMIEEAVTIIEEWSQNE